jgi:hypothetical protein
LNEHVTVDDLIRFRAGELTPEETVRVGQHLAKCKECAVAARRSQDAAVVAEGFRHAMRDDSDIERQAGRRWFRAAAIAAVVAVALFSTIAYLMTQRATIRTQRATAHLRVARVNYGRSDWNQLVNQALTSGHVPSPDLTDLAAAGGTLRSDRGAPQRVDPEGVVVESDRPRFSWPAVPHAATYEVVVYRGDREVLRSGRVRETTFVPERALDRGAVYQWQVLVTKADQTMEILPSGPAAPALIRVLSDSNAAELAQARQRFPSDPLLLGTLEAHFGLIDDARREFTAAAQQHPDDASVARLRDALIGH